MTYKSELRGCTANDPVDQHRSMLCAVAINCKQAWHTCKRAVCSPQDLPSAHVLQRIMLEGSLANLSHRVGVLPAVRVPGEHLYDVTRHQV